MRSPFSWVGGERTTLTAYLAAVGIKCGFRPNVPKNNATRRSAIDARTTRHPGYRISTIKRKRIEEPFWLDEDRRRFAQDPASWARLGGMVLRPDCCRLQSRSRPQASGRNGMSPSGASNMRQNRNQRRLCSADRDPSLRFFDPQTPRKSLQNQVFQQPASRREEKHAEFG